ncbi:glyoxylate/hydroxypyruvate reductase A [Litorivita sp. NS0012-18]|uniref:2-hydroxyacid dehydrogenase n=1 Tax=Litorivita sp. NS0012-18 TaxID=3127655 RepID=UPI00310559EA
MTVKVLFAGRAGLWDSYETHLKTALAAAGVEAEIGPQVDPQEARYLLISVKDAPQDYAAFPRLRAVQTLSAGVEHVAGNPTLRVPLARLVDTGLTQGMVEWCTGHVLRHHLGMDAQITRNEPIWDPKVPPLAWSRKVTVLGLGALGQAVGEALAALGFEVHGWSRSPKSIAGITCHHGDEGLKSALQGAEIVVLLLPKTAATENVINAQSMAQMARGAVIINPGRGPLIDDEALIAALDEGQIGHATLDVFRAEPLPQAHPFWAHPNITVTPHIASETRPETAAQVVAENIRRSEAGEEMLHLVDAARGY